MAVVTARRARADIVAKDRILHSRAREEQLFRKKMSFPVAPQPPVASDQIPMTSPNPEDKFAVPQGGVDRDALRKRKASKSRPTDLRRSASTPHLGKVGHSDAGVLSPTNEKKRNKLGYHRSSIACSHCRRRKIRCQLPIPEDTQGRCTNCIRLKKECNFYPVDQAPPTETRAAHPVRKDTALSGAPSASSQSSPHISGASQPGSVADEAAHLHLHSPKVDPEARQQRESGGYAMTAGTEASTHSTPFEFANAGGGAWTEHQPALNQYPQQHRASIAEPQYWSVNSTPTTAHYSHDSAMSFNTTTPTTFASPNFAYTHGGNPPFVPVRSMSFGHIEGMSQHFGYQGIQYGHQETQTGYSLPSHPQFGQPALPQQLPGNIAQNSAAPESVPRTWNVAPPVQAPMTASGQYGQTMSNSYYPQQAMDVYDNRTNPGYHQQAQYYPAASNPG